MSAGFAHLRKKSNITKNTSEDISVLQQKSEISITTLPEGTVYSSDTLAILCAIKVNSLDELRGFVICLQSSNGFDGIVIPGSLRKRLGDIERRAEYYFSKYPNKEDLHSFLKNAKSISSDGAVMAMSKALLDLGCHAALIFDDNQVYPLHPLVKEEFAKSLSVKNVYTYAVSVCEKTQKNTFDMLKYLLVNKKGRDLPIFDEDWASMRKFITSWVLAGFISGSDLSGVNLDAYKIPKEPLSHGPSLVPMDLVYSQFATDVVNDLFDKAVPVFINSPSTMAQQPFDNGGTNAVHINVYDEKSPLAPFCNPAFTCVQQDINMAKDEVWRYRSLQKSCNDQAALELKNEDMNQTQITTMIQKRSNSLLLDRLPQEVEYDYNLVDRFVDENNQIVPMGTLPDSTADVLVKEHFVAFYKPGLSKLDEVLDVNQVCHFTKGTVASKAVTVAPGTFVPFLVDPVSVVVLLMPTNMLYDPDEDPEEFTTVGDSFVSFVPNVDSYYKSSSFHLKLYATVLRDVFLQGLSSRVSNPKHDILDELLSVSNAVRQKIQENVDLGVGGDPLWDFTGGLFDDYAQAYYDLLFASMNLVERKWGSVYITQSSSKTGKKKLNVAKQQATVIKTNNTRDLKRRPRRQIRAPKVISRDKNSESSTETEDDSNRSQEDDLSSDLEN